MLYFLRTGLVKAKQYDWKDSNLALFGSDTEKQVKSKSEISHCHIIFAKPNVIPICLKIIK